MRPTRVAGITAALLAPGFVSPSSIQAESPVIEISKSEYNTLFQGAAYSGDKVYVDYDDGETPKVVSVGGTPYYLGIDADGNLYSIHTEITGSIWDRTTHYYKQLVGEGFGGGAGGGANVSGDQVSTYFLCRFYLLLT